MRAEQYLKTCLECTIKKLGYTWPKKAVIEIPQNTLHGDLATNIALVLANNIGINPKNIAEKIAEKLQQESTSFSSVSVAGPGFLNITFSPTFWQKTINHILSKGSSYGSCQLGNKQKVLIEYVSANPTGPLHIGHGRGAAIGDTLARLLRFTGYNVTTEYYINDAGRQMQLLGLSIWLRIKELSGIQVTWPEEYYKGTYIIEIAKALLEEQPDIISYTDIDGEQASFHFGMNVILNGIKQDLKTFKVEHEEWFSERTLIKTNAIEQTLKALECTGLTFEKEGALWFQSTVFGDDKDRVLRKSDKSLTYFALDIAYHYTKYNRGFDRIIDILGADHHGYIARIKAAMQAFGHDPMTFDIILIQLVSLLENGIQVAMSTRAGQFEKLIDVINEVGVDAARFMFLLRKSDAHLDFDLELVKQRTMNNPVYYVQYAYARICSIIRKAHDLGFTITDVNEVPLSNITTKDELNLLRLLDKFEDVIYNAAQHLAPHYITHYLMELAGELHSYYAKYPVLQSNEKTIVLSRLALLQAVGQVIYNALNILGVTAPKNM
ncbi:arginine--tRNA ligase [Lawsonia intracellularis]|uniref:Arginine--tRNA ligase n=1 Tax=Lawsonia intracellularis (strain PHE/MN1-00) TaxID=363253 RepID=SYR_LAWIP|nr:arginine--tRNA ligase [Lawsonia intracellularis]Q1MRU1.1 RecName: Full=Arginine--tRNA ligase; AltName: Full=Arginyl-tRNA synthetase; Short=ArgRS [Lawsonia intracellularis PHE/MN1-00]AGC49635.1 arginyl-tRNA synthetase [Lawsonia intracellularis N343]KAA0205141.1 arginine--tRNA ligase [Lawsonia intracellularis]MBZ3892331.1 arginine--tRNA ligase [Lawsonia intracellularis]RBN32312.1 arginine--tRNA ligase [Lawsonia intracellularis]RBN33879.1 arginine--tRNA ligase [Lawsonia intracellularis]